MQRNVFEPWFYLDPDAVTPTCRRFHGRYALGLGFISLVAVIWIVSSVIAQYLYAEESFDSPFLLTYLGLIEFAFILPIKYLTDRIGFTEDVCMHAPPDDEDDENESPDGYAVKSTDYRDIMAAMTDDISVKTSEILRKLPENVHWNHTKHFQAACFIAPVMFIGKQCAVSNILSVWHLRAFAHACPLFFSIHVIAVTSVCSSTPLECQYIMCTPSIGNYSKLGIQCCSCLYVCCFRHGACINIECLCLCVGSHGWRRDIYTRQTAWSHARYIRYCIDYLP
jgi:hypothetical protein